jgi:hypothetical protein
MNLEIIKKYVELYKANFSQINTMEIYKWRAVYTFQQEFDINANDFHEMLTKALSKTSNLMDSGQYFPRRMMLRNASDSPEEVRALFIRLFDQDVDRISRITSFSSGIKALNNKNYSVNGWKDYQDHRAIVVYLNLMYPEDNYFYKFKMLNDLVQKIDYDYTVKKGSIANIVHFYSICDLIKDVLIEDNDIVRLHHSRLGATEYFDSNLNILTQDFIYALTNHLDTPEIENPEKLDVRLTEGDLSAIKKKTSLSGHHVDHERRTKRNKRIGDLGELLAIKFEKENMSQEMRYLVTHDAKNIGDGLGYDVKSVDEQGHDKLIEVKTTTGSLSSPFFVTSNELECSRRHSSNYYVYRFFNFDEEDNSADLRIIRGDLSGFCVNPVHFEVKVKETVVN